MVQVSVYSRRIEDLEQFMDALDKTGMFAGVMSRADRPQRAADCSRKCRPTTRLRP